MAFSFTEEDLLRECLPKPTINDVYNHVNHYDMFRFYVGDFKLGKPILSPLDNEKKPSFSIYARGGQILFNDFRLGGGDIIKFVCKRFNISYYEAICKIIHDAGLSNRFNTGLNTLVKPVIHHNIKIKDTNKEIRIKARKPMERDIEFWAQFHITEETLRKYRVVPISMFFINNKPIKADRLAYAFIEEKDNKSSYTIYQPYSPTYKWTKSHDSSVFYGWTQLPEKGPILILTKSLKDIMTINSITGLPAVSLQGEGVKPKPHVIEELKSRFNKIYVLYDNDFSSKRNWGEELGERISKEHDLLHLKIPNGTAFMFKAKDTSDLAKNAGVEEVKKLFANIDKNVIHYKIPQERIDELKKIQNNPMLHGYTCPGDNQFCRTSKYNDGLLIPTPDGWVCPCGEYKQKIYV